MTHFDSGTDLFLLCARTAVATTPVASCHARRVVCTMYGRFGHHAAQVYAGIVKLVAEIEQHSRRPFRWGSTNQCVLAHDEVSIIGLIEACARRDPHAQAAHLAWLVPHTSERTVLEAAQVVADLFGASGLSVMRTHQPIQVSFSDHSPAATAETSTQERQRDSVIALPINVRS